MARMGEVGRGLSCLRDGWHGQALAVVEGTSVHWACPRCCASHTGLRPGKPVPRGKARRALLRQEETSA